MIRFAGILLASVVLSGCVASNGPRTSAIQLPQADVVTGSIARGGTVPQPGTDQAAVVNAVATASLGADMQNVPWANSETGAAGVITAIHQTRRSGTTCRTFETSRQSYDGIALYAGKACEDAGGAWESLYFRLKRASDSIDPIATSSIRED